MPRSSFHTREAHVAKYLMKFESHVFPKRLDFFFAVREGSVIFPPKSVCMFPHFPGFYLHHVWPKPWAKAYGWHQDVWRKLGAGGKSGLAITVFRDLESNQDEDEKDQCQCNARRQSSFQVFAQRGPRGADFFTWLNFHSGESLSRNLGTARTNSQLECTKRYVQWFSVARIDAIMAWGKW